MGRCDMQVRATLGWTVKAEGKCKDYMAVGGAEMAGASANSQRVQTVRTRSRNWRNGFMLWQ